MVGGEFGEKVPVVREAAGFFRTGPAPPDKRNAPPKRPPTLHAGGAESSPAVWPVGITQGYTLRYTLSYRLKLHPAPPHAGCSVRSGEVAEGPPRRDSRE